MANRAWADNAELKRLVGKSLTYGADDWVVSNEDATRAYVETKEGE
jgi:hypothetical protein